MALEGRVVHQRPATGEAAIGIGAEVIGRVAVGKLDQPPEGPEEVAHRLVDHHAARLGRRRRTAEIAAQKLLFLRRVHPGLDREIAKIPHRVVHAGIFPVDDPHPIPGIEEVLAQGITMAGRQRRRMNLKRLADRTGGRDDIVIALGQGDVPGREHLQIVRDHREQFEPEAERLVGPVQHGEGLAGAARRSGARLEERRSHRLDIRDRLRDQDPGG